MQNKFKKIILIIPIALFLLCCSLFFFIFKEIKNNVKILEQSEVNLKEEALKREEIKDFDNLFKSIEQEKTLFETHFVQSSDIVPFLNTIEKIANSIGTKAEVSFIEIAKDNSGLILEMKNRGSFERVYKFLMLLENSPYELEFMSIEMHSSFVEDSEKNKNDTKKNEWEALFRIKLISFI